MAEAIDCDSIMRPCSASLSYTSFEQKLNDVTYKGWQGSPDVDQTTGDSAGDVVEVRLQLPYTDGGIEKASTNLVAFEKTRNLPGAF